MQGNSLQSAKSDSDDVRCHFLVEKILILLGANHTPQCNFILLNLPTAMQSLGSVRTQKEERKIVTYMIHINFLYQKVRHHYGDINQAIGPPIQNNSDGCLVDRFNIIFKHRQFM